MLFVFRLLLLVIAQTQLNAAPSSPASAPTASDDMSVAVITMGPGDAPWEKFGHVMLEIRDPARGLDVSFNWGVFDFEQKNFIWNFIQGKMLYWMEPDDTLATLDFYKNKLDRTIWVQELNLSRQQKQELLERCMWNAQDENRFYRYDYYIDNCSTRVRDAVDQVLGGQIKRQATQIQTDVTYRSETSRLMASDPLLYTGLYFILGHPVDHHLTAWQEMFVPMRMRERFNEMTITDEAGRRVPLVKWERILNVSRRPSLRATPPNWIAWFIAAGLVIGGAQLWGEQRARNGARLGRSSFGLVTVLWSLLASVAGCFLIYGWFFTDHTAVRPNENILQMSPLLLPLIVLVPLSLRSGKRAFSVLATALAGLALLGAVVGFVLKALPAMDQTNANIIALALPANAGLAWALWRWSSRAVEPQPPEAPVE